MIKNHIKGGLKVLGDYMSALLIYFVLLYTFIALTKDRFTDWLPVYSFVIFLFMTLILYSDMWSLASKEKKPQYQIKPYPLKGLVLGLIGFLPFIILQIIAAFLKFDDPALNNLKIALLQNILLGPLYFSLNLFGKTTAAYIISSLIVPIISMVSYLLGFYDIEIRKVLKIKQEVEVERKQELSPWNPSRQDFNDDKKKKKKKNNKT